MKYNDEVRPSVLCIGMDNRADDVVGRLRINVTYTLGRRKFVYQPRSCTTHHIYCISSCQLDLYRIRDSATEEWRAWSGQMGQFR